MSDAPLPVELLQRLKRFDTPTICNGLEEILGSLPVNCTVRPLMCVQPTLPPIVGYARTATVQAGVRSEQDPAAVLEQRLGYYEHIVSGPQPTITVIQDLDEPAGQGAWWGEVHTAVHKALGSLGVVTDGAVRDLDTLAPGFQVLAGGTSPSHGFAHVVDTACRVAVQGMIVFPGDLVHADRHGAVVIPPNAAADLPAAIDRIVRREGLLLEACKRPGFGVAAIREALQRGNDIH